MTGGATDDGFPILDDPIEDLLRQVHGTLLKADGTPLPYAFAPAPRDEGLLSTRRSAITPKIAFEQWTPLNGDDRNAMWSLNVGEAEKQELTCFDDSSSPKSPPGHASVDFRRHDDERRRLISRKLAGISRRLHP